MCGLHIETDCSSLLVEGTVIRTFVVGALPSVMMSQSSVNLASELVSRDRLIEFDTPFVFGI